MYPAPLVKRNLTPLRLFGLGMMAVGAIGWWYNWHLARTQGEFYIKLCILGPLGIFGGLLMLVRPDWAGPWRSDSPRGQKISMIAVLSLMAIFSGIDMYRLNRPCPKPAYIRWNPSMGTPAISVSTRSVAMETNTTDITFLAQQYRLGSYNQKHNPQWEFVTPHETVDNWTTLLTIIDRPDARTKEELDRLSEGIMANYKSHGGRILAARTMADPKGTFNYMVAAFEEPDKNRIELNFVKMSLGPAGAVVAIYGVRIGDPQDYRTKARDYLDQKSSEVGRALGEAVLPDMASLPRRVF